MMQSYGSASLMRRGWQTAEEKTSAVFILKGGYIEKIFDSNIR
jgi:hypothetical protein